jgi:hypothetical protein
MRKETTSRTLSNGLLAYGMVLALGGCDKESPVQSGEEPEHSTALLLSQAQFVKEEVSPGKERVVPGPAKLAFVYPYGSRWTLEVVEDADSNVFHKAMPFDLLGEPPGILTIAGNAAPRPAILKIWRRAPNGWLGSVLWEGRFGGNFNRLRDVEIGDVTGDHQPDIVVGTHDQGLVVVLQKSAGTWQPMEIDRKPGTFVHEIEIGDVDGDGRNEIFATPSAPNKVDGTPQPGWVVMYRQEGDKFSRHVIEEFSIRHVKEILVADVKGAGRPSLYAALEGQLGRSVGPGENEDDVEIKEYRSSGSGLVGVSIATLPDKQCRFLNAGDVDADGKAELIASTYRSGIWIIKPVGSAWATALIDEDSGGYEHATALADMDGDGALEIYVAADKQQQLRRYCWTGQEFERTDLSELTEGDITFGLMPCLNAKCLATRYRPRTVSASPPDS